MQCQCQNDKKVIVLASDHITAISTENYDFHKSDYDFHNFAL